jgi:predicted  nucleic acid-binding Zn-ribbon protein
MLQTSLERLEGEVRRLRAENARLVEKLEGAKEGAAQYSALQKELDQLRWQISKMEDSRYASLSRA